MGEVIVITSGKGGVGKTTTTVNIGCALAMAGKKTILLDADIGLRNLDVVMGLDDKVVYDFLDVIEGRCHLRQAVIEDKRNKNLFMLAASQTGDKSDVELSKIKKLCDELREQYDYVLIDCPAGIEQGFDNAVGAAERAIVVVTPEYSSIRDADRILGKLEDVDMENVGLLINRVRPNLIRRGQAPGTDEIIEILATDLIGIVPDDEEVIICANKGKIVTSNGKGKAAVAYKNIAARIMGNTMPLADLEDDGSLRYKIKRIFRKKNTGVYFSVN